MSFFFKHLNLSETTHNRLYRDDEFEIPYDALRESIVNAHCHMNWGYEVATVGLAIYDDRIKIAWLGHPKTGHWVFVKDIRQRMLKGIFNIESSRKSEYYPQLCVVEIRRTLKYPGVQKREHP